VTSAEDVVLYDLDGTDDPDALVEMVADPSHRWYARARLASLAVRGLTAATWNPALHPRGRDGKFIHKFGWVRWMINGMWRRGQVTHVKDGTINVRFTDPKTGLIKDTPFNVDQAASWLYATPTPKATLALPDPKNGVDVQAFEKVGGQGGSNPGGMYKVTDVDASFGPQGSVTIEQLTDVVHRHGLDSTTNSDDNKNAVGYNEQTGEVFFATDPTHVYDASGTLTDISAITTNTTWYTGDKAPHAWGELIAISDLLNTGQKVYVKRAKSPEHARNEVLANRLYELAGVNVAETIMGSDGITLGSKLIPQVSTKVDLKDAVAAGDTEALDRVRRDFVIDAWLANWDVLGLDLENTQIVDGYPYRIDAGGALLYRAQGSPKGPNFGSMVGELESLRDPKINPQAASVFGGVTDTHLEDGAQRLAAVSPAQIQAHVDAADMPPELGGTLIARREFILDALGVDDPFADGGEAPEVVAVVPQPEGVQAPAPKPDPDPDQTTIGPSKVWDSEQQTWVQSVEKPDEQAPFLKLVALYDDPDLFMDIHAENFSWDLDEQTAYALLDGSLVKVDWYVHGEGAKLHGTVVSTGEERTFPVPDGTPLRAMLTSDDDPNKSLVDAAVASIVGLEKILRERSITDIASKSTTADIFAMADSQPGLEPEVGTPYPPQFKADTTTIYWYSDVGATLHAGNEDAKYIWDPSQERLFQILPGEGSVLQLMDPVTGAFVEDPHFVDGQEVQVVRSTDLYSMEMMEAFIQTVKADLAGDDAEPPGLSDETIATLKALDQKAEQVVPDVQPAAKAPVKYPHQTYANLKDIVTASYQEQGKYDLGLGLSFFDEKFPDVGPDGVISPHKIDDYLAYLDPALAEIIAGKLQEATGAPAPSAIPDTTKIAWADALNSLKSGLLNTGVPDASIDGVVNDFHQSFPPSSGDGTIDHGVFKMWVFDREIAGLADKVDNWLLGHQDGFDTPQIPLPPSKIENVNDQLVVGEAFKFADLTGDEKVKKAESLVGKMVYMALESHLSGEDTIALKTVNGDSPVFSLALVEEYTDNNTVKIRLPNGAKKAFPLSYGTAADGGVFRVVENFDADDFKLAPQPVLKADGTITYAGEVVGEWEKSSSYWTKYDYTIYADHTILGKAVTGSVGSKGGVRTFSTFLLVPKPVPTKGKKTPSTKKIADAVKVMPTLDANYGDGTPAKIGDWVKSTKGGGGFVGKIVGWPDQGTNPGLVFAVDIEGVQKAVKLKTQKKVPAPANVDLLDLEVDFPGQPVPSTYTGIKFADGKIPLVGQTVEAGKPGGTKVTGIVTNINPKQGWVYILQPNGKTVSKTFSVTKVLEEPDLVWDLNSAPATVSAITTKVKPKKPGKKGPLTYPGPEGAAIVQSEDAKAAWLDANPKRKLTKDGFIPTVGMRVRNKAGDELVISEVAGEWAPNPNRVGTYNITQGKKTSTSTTSIEVDHEAELTGFDGELVRRVGSVVFPTADLETNTPTLPDGSVVYRYSYTFSWWSHKQHQQRSVTDWAYFAITPDGTSVWPSMHTTGGSHGWSASWPSSYMPQKFKNVQPEHLEKVAVVDSSQPGTISITVMNVSGSWESKQVTASSITLPDDLAPVPDVAPLPDLPEPDAPLPDPEPDDVTPLPDLPDVAPLPDLPEPDVAPEPEPEAVDTNTPAPPTIIPTTSLQPLAGETPITTATPEEAAAIVEPPVPSVGEPVNLGVSTPISAPSIAASAQKMLEQKDSKAPGSGFAYALGDSDLVEDMLFRHSVERRPDGQEYLVTRFRLREDVSEDVMAKIVTTTNNTPHIQKFGGWKTTGQLYPFDLNEGDAIYLRLSGTTGLLKPGTGTETVPDTPNARVSGEPVKIGTSTFEGADVDLWRVPVITADGSHGEVDMQARAGASIHVYEWDPLYPIPVNTSKKLQLQTTQVATTAGWTRVGGMDMDGSAGMKPDEKGIPSFGGSTLGSMASGSPGSRVHRKLDDGTLIMMNGALSVESGTGNESTRKANVAGEVRVSVPLQDGKPADTYTEALSKAMQAVGIPPEKQQPPSQEQLYMLGLEKFVGTHHATYKYRGGSLNGPDDPRIAQTLARLDKEIGSFLGRKVELSDILIKQHETGRIQYVLSHDVGKAIAKRKKIDYFTHDGAAGNMQYILGGTTHGLLSADERWSLGVIDSLYMHRDMRIGSGDRMYMYSKAGKSYGTGQIVMAAPMIASSLEIYNNYANDSDKYGARGDTNPFLTSVQHAETMYKRSIERDLITFYVLGTEHEKAALIKQLKARGVTHINGRPIEEIVVTKDEAKAQGDIEDIGKGYWDDAIPITTLVGAGEAAAP
jgi:hypothetical protein